MTQELSPNTQAILLLTAPLIVGRGKGDVAPLTAAEYRRLARALHERKQQPSDLLELGAEALARELARVADPERLERLLGRGFLLSQALERWRSRAIWVVSRADLDYPRRIRGRLRDDAPPVIYGCGGSSLVNAGGLAVVGSRHVDQELTDLAEAAGRLAAEAGRNLVSGGARGIDQAAMRGSLEAGGTAVGVLADSLEKQAVRREHRAMLMERRLVLVSPYDPAAGFNVGHAMQRNKLVYALADAALVVSSDYNKGGTWAGAVEQLEKLHFVPVYVRRTGAAQKGLDALRSKGALAWPQPESAEDLAALLRAGADTERVSSEREQPELPLSGGDAVPRREAPFATRATEGAAERQGSASPVAGEDGELKRVRELLGRAETPQDEQEVAEQLGMSKMDARKWLHRLVEDGVLEKLTKPRVRYRTSRSIGPLFDK